MMKCLVFSKTPEVTHWQIGWWEKTEDSLLNHPSACLSCWRLASSLLMRWKTLPIILILLHLTSEVWSHLVVHNMICRTILCIKMWGSRAHSLMRVQMAPMVTRLPMSFPILTARWWRNSWTTWATVGETARGAKDTETRKNWTYNSRRRT